MTITYRDTKGEDLDPAEVDANFRHVLDSANGTFVQSGTGAGSRTVQAKEREIVSVTDFEVSSGVLVAGDGVQDDRVGIQRGITQTAIAGQFLYVPAHTYRLTKGAAQTDEAGTTYPCLTMASNMHILAEPGATFKLADSQSTDVAPVNIAMFFSNSTLANLSWRNLTMDMNGANNKISPSRASGTFSHKTFAHIMFSGTPAGVAASGTDVLIDSCTLKNTPGVTCVGMAQSNTASVTLGSRWIVRNSLFNNNGLDDNDHTSIFGWADDVLYDGNTFTADTMTGVDGGTGTGVGANCAIEVHGANQRLIGNKVKNYYVGFWLGNNYTSAVENVIIDANDIGPVKALGIDSYRAKPGTATPGAVKKVQITNNSIQLSDDTTTLALKVAIQIPATEQAITDYLISNNRAEKTGTTIGSAFFSLAAATTAANKHDNITVTNNVARGFSRGVVLTTNATNGLGIVDISDNAILDCIAAGAFNAVGLIFDPSVAPPIDELRVRGNSFLDTAGSPSMLYGMYLGSGVITRFYLGPNVYRGATVANYTEVSVTITNREGDSVLTNTQTGATYTVLPADTDIIANRAGTVTLTLEPVLTAPNKRLLVRTIQAQTVVSASANVVPLAGGAAGTAILAATAGKWALLKSDGTNWQIMAAN